VKRAVLDRSGFYLSRNGTVQPLSRLIVTSTQRDAHRIGADHDTDNCKSSQGIAARGQRANLRRSPVAGARGMRRRGERTDAWLRVFAANLVSVRRYHDDARRFGVAE